MLKFRIIPVMLWEHHGLVKGKQFNPDRRVGSVIPTVKIYNARDVDELFLVDIRASKDNSDPRFEDIKRISAECSIPLTIGGGINTLKHVELLLRAGADKVALNSATYENLQLVTDVAERFGSQCIVASIDYRYINSVPECFSHAGTRACKKDPIRWANQLETAGAGEILLTCIDNDGMMSGFDIPTIRAVSNEVKIPVIASGGASEYSDFGLAITEGGASAVAAGSIFHFTEKTPRGVRDYLRDIGLPVRKTVSAT
jgi:cyclase